LPRAPTAIPRISLDWPKCSPASATAREAIAAMAEAIALEKDDFTMLMTYAELLHQEGRNDDALQTGRHCHRS